MLLVSAGTATFLVQQTWWDSDDIPSLQDAIASNQGFEGTDEYDPATDDHYNLPQKAPRVQVLPLEESEGAPPKVKIEIQRWTAEEKIVAVESPGPARVALRLLNYPAWRVEVLHEGRTNQTEAEDSNQVIAPVPVGHSVIRVHFIRTADRTAGAIGTVVAVFILLSLNWWKLRTTNPTN